MTIIIGLTNGKEMCFGGDSCISNKDGDKEILKNPKVFAKRDPKGTLWMMGYAGDIRFGQVVQHNLVLPSVTPVHMENLIGFLVSEFVNNLRNCLNDAGALAEEKRRQESGGSLILGINGQIFTIDHKFQVILSDNSFACIGSGSIAALGALGATKGLLDPQTKEPLDQQERIILAMEQAQEYNDGVSDPFLIINSKEAEESVRYVRSRRKRKR